MLTMRRRIGVRERERERERESERERGTLRVWHVCSMGVRDLPARGDEPTGGGSSGNLRFGKGGDVHAHTRSNSVCPTSVELAPSGTQGE